MKTSKPFNLHKWIKENEDLLRPPIGNQKIYLDNDDFIVMIVGGPNKRKDYHYNESEELFYQLKGDIVLKVIEEGKPKDINIKEGEMFLLPAKVFHSPQRPTDTVGLVIERYRREHEKDGFLWICERCHNPLYKTYFKLHDIVRQLPQEMDHFYGSDSLRTCKKCGHFMEKP